MPHVPKPTDRERFWNKVEIRADGDCWPWKASTRHGGHGSFRYEGQMVPAHRFAFLLEHGRWPTPCGLHSCDNPPCCNPAHIEEGTRQDNVRQMNERGRRAPTFGSRHPQSKLSERDVEIIKILVLRLGLTRTEVAVRYGVTRSAIGHIASGRTWNPEYRGLPKLAERAKISVDQLEI
jgi:hypothetical protein